MNDKKLIKALIVGGSIATGVALNSTGVMAAELDEANADINVADNGEQEVVNETIQDMNDACDVIEGDVVAAESYLEQAHDYINNDWMTDAAAKEITDGSNSVERQARDKNQEIQREYENVSAEETAAEEEFNKQAANSGLDELAADCKDAEDIQKKVEVINKAVETSNNDFKNFTDAHTSDLDSYNSVVHEVNEAEAAYAEAEEAFKDADDEYAWIIEDPRTISARQVVAETEDGPAPYSKYKEELENGGDPSALWYDYAFYWDEDVREAITWLDSVNEATSKRNNAEKEVAARREKLEGLKANEGYGVIAPEKKKNDDFVAAANKYKDAVIVKAEAAVIAARAQAAYEKVAAVAEETNNLVNAYTATNTAANNETINNMMNDIVGVEAGANTVEQNYNQTKELVDGNTLTAEVAVQKIDNVSAALSSAQTAADELQEKYDGVVAATDSAKAEFENAAANNGLTDYATKCKDTANTLEKIGVINSAIEAADKNHATFVSEHADDVVDDETYEEIRYREIYIAELEEQISTLEWVIRMHREEYERAPWENRNNPEMIADEENQKLYCINELEATKAELEALKGASYEVVTAEQANYDSFIAAANTYKEAIAVKSQADVVYERGQNGLAKAVSFSTQLTELITAYDEAQAGVVSDDAKELAAEIADAQRDVLRAEAAYNTADEEFNAFAAETEAARAEYDRLAAEKAVDPVNEEIAKEWAFIAEENEFLARYNEVMMNYEYDSDEYQQITEEYYNHGEFGPEYAIAKAQQRIDEYETHLVLAYDYPMSLVSGEVERYNDLKATRDAAAQTLADAQKKLDELNAKKAELGNAATENDTPVVNPETPAEETALSQDVYTVFNNVKAIVMENPELLQKVYALYNNEKAVDAAKYAYNYVVANVDISTINAYAKQIAGMNITPEVVNTYLDMFTNWINK